MNILCVLDSISETWFVSTGTQIKCNETPQTSFFRKWTSLNIVYLSKFSFRNNFLCCAQKRQSWQQTGTVGAWESQDSSLPDLARLICPHQLIALADLHKCAAFSDWLTWHPATHYSWLQSNPICQNTLFLKKVVLFQDKIKHKFHELQRNSHSN